TAGERGEVADAARIAGGGSPLEQRPCLSGVFGDAVAGAVHDAELDHGRARTLVGSLTIGGDRFGRLAVGGIGAAELIQRAARGRRGLAVFDGDGDVGG